MAASGRLLPAADRLLAAACTPLQPVVFPQSVHSMIEVSVCRVRRSVGTMPVTVALLTEGLHHMMRQHLVCR